MPCRDDYAVSEPSHELDSLRTERNTLKKRLDRVTRVACEMEKLLARWEQATLSEDAQAWIKEHRAADAKRKREETARAERDRVEKARKAKLQRDRAVALNKLSRSERTLLGLPHPAEAK